MKIEMITPTKLFKNVPVPSNKSGDELPTRDRILAMTDEQMRYALLAVLVVLFGSEYSNAGFILQAHLNHRSSRLEMNEAMLILAQLVGVSTPEGEEWLTQQVREISA